MEEHVKPPREQSPEPVSSIIRARLMRANKRFHANDNIAAFLEPGELDALLGEVEGKVKGLLESLVVPIPLASWAQVVDSRHPDFRAGEYVTVRNGWQQYAL